MQKRIFYSFPNHLLNFMTCGLVGGICIAHFTIHLIWAFPLFLFFALLTYRYAHHPFNNSTTSILIVILSIVLGYARYRNQTSTFERLYQDHGSVMDCEAVVESVERSSHKKFKWILSLTTSRVKVKDQWTNDTHILQIYTCKKPTLLAGDIIEVTNLSIKKPNNPDFKNYLKKEKIGATFFVPHCKTRLLHRPFLSLKRILARYKERLIITLKKKLSPRTYNLFCTIFLGKKSKQVISNIKQECKVWGISHYLARSGLHLIVFILIWSFFLNLLRIQYYTKSILLILIALIYYLLSWASISFNRAFFTFLLHHLCTFFLLTPPISHLLMIVCFGTLANNPYQLFSLDFQLSFSLALAIAWFNQISYQRQGQSQLKYHNSPKSLIAKLLFS